MILRVLLASLAIATAQVPPEEATKKLARIGEFAFGGVGVAGTVSEGEAAFRTLFASPAAAADFHKLLSSGNVQAKCYALVALHKLEPEKFPGLAAKFQTSKTGVQTISGCMIAELPMGSVVASIAKGRYDIYLEKPRPR